MTKITSAKYFYGACLQLALLLVLLIGCKKNPASPEVEETWQTIDFSGYKWEVKSSETLVGPGKNYFSNRKSDIWKDDQGQLHLKIVKRNDRWYCTEIWSDSSFGYGEYIFYLASRVDNLDRNVVLGLFTYKWRGEVTPKEYENDIEFSRWGTDAMENAQYVFQYRIADGIDSTDDEENKITAHKFNISLTGDYSTHKFIWSQGRLHFQSYHGHYQNLPSNDYLISDTVYVDNRIPPESNEKVHINLWLYDSNKDSLGNSPSNGQEVEVIIKRFEFIPLTEGISIEYQDNIVKAIRNEDTLWQYNVNANATGVFWPDANYTVRKVIHDDLDNDGKKEVVVVAGHKIWYPAQILTLDETNGNVLGKYWNPGIVVDAVVFDINNDGKKEIVCGGGNNDANHPSVFALPPTGAQGQAPPYYGNATQGNHIWYTMLPLSGANGSNFVQTVSIEQNYIKALNLNVPYTYKIDFNGNIIP